MNKDGQNLTPDEAAAHEFLSELRTRITTQPLPYQYGVEAKALESLWEVFGQARAAMKIHPGCAEFARRTTRMLNVDLRPVTAKWHRAYSEGRLNSRDGANEFREDLAALQKKLREFAGELHVMAYGRAGLDELTPPALTPEAITALFDDLPFGIAKTPLIADAAVDAINAAEAQSVAARRRNYGIEPGAKNAVGLGLSGGGIRSATFCLGVTQVLAERDLLKDVDFLSTVSGGGFVGSFLTRRLDSRTANARVAAPHGTDPEPIRYLRQHAKYLAASNLKERWLMVTATFAGMILNWSAPLFLMACAALITDGIWRYAEPRGAHIPWPEMFLAAAGVTVLSLLFYAYGIRCAQRWGGALLGASTAVTLAVAFLWLLTRAYGWIDRQDLAITWGIAGFFAAATTAVPAIIRFIPVLSKPEVRRLVLKVMLMVAGLVIPFGAIAVFFCFYKLGSLHADPAAAVWSPLRYVDGWVLLLAMTALLGAVALFLLDINLTGPHRLYRDQLAQAFIQLRENDEKPAPLDAINPGDFAPYQLINATLNLPSSTSIALRERKSDFFIFSKFWCGAPAIGYVQTSQWRAGKSSLDLATAVAVSGAAVSPYMGLGSFPTLTALMTFLNVRLDYWMLRPRTRKVSARPGFSCLIREMTGIAMSERQAWINLSDGGHIENMGIYELLRRRCKFIISIDGESDPQSTFQGHLTLVRHAQIDFGIRIEPDLSPLRPDLTSKFSQVHSMMCRVHYPPVGAHPGGQGLILYMKLSVTGNELETIKRYRALHPDFPHQTTLDQFFDEEQFEAYRQLGVHVAEGLFAPALLGERTRPAAISEWFRGLAGNLLDPERA